MKSDIKLQVLLEHQTGAPVMQCRAVPVNLGTDFPKAFLIAYSSVFDDDPYVEMFFFPDDNLHLMLLLEDGRVLWEKDLGKGVLPGVWFCPVLAFDLDADGIDEIWFVNNLDQSHPLGISNYCLERLDAISGKTTGQWPWPNHGGKHQSLSHMFRNFIIGGFVRGVPVLVTAQGTYNGMYLQGFKPDMSERWQHEIPANSAGARGSHMIPVLDINADGIDEVLWGERCIELDSGTELFCADREFYRGHSDVIQPIYDRTSGIWSFYTCRESDPSVSPRIALFDAEGKRVWGALESGHIDMGFVSHRDESGVCLATAVRIGEKTCGKDGRFHASWEEFSFDADTGKPVKVPFSIYKMIPVDLDGDGYHEFVQGAPGGSGDVFDRNGGISGTVNGSVALAAKLLDYPGEQLLTYHKDGTIKIWGNKNAVDTSVAVERYGNPYYASCLRLQGNGYNWGLLGGL